MKAASTEHPDCGFRLTETHYGLLNDAENNSIIIRIIVTCVAFPRRAEIRYVDKRSSLERVED